MKRAHGLPSFRIMLLSFLIFFLAAVPARAQVIVLGFEGLQDNEAVSEYYNGGFGGSGSGPGPGLGISFSNGVASIDSDAGGTGDFGGEPSPSTALFWLSGPGGSIMNVPAGFSSGISFYYSAPYDWVLIDVHEGLDGTGTILASLMLPVTPVDGGDPNGTYSPFVAEGISFSGIARSVVFTGDINQAAFDDLTLGSDIPGFPSVPVLSHWGIILLLSFLFIIAGFFIYRRRNA